MCGIAGVLTLHGQERVPANLLWAMAESVREQLRNIDRLASAAGGEAAAAQAELLD